MNPRFLFRECFAISIPDSCIRVDYGRPCGPERLLAYLAQESPRNLISLCFGNDDDGVKLDAIAHGNHPMAAVFAGA